MKVMIIIDHPWPESFNFAIAERVEETLKDSGHDVDYLDLHREDFDPVLRQNELEVYTKGKALDPKVAEYQRRISSADHLVFIFPVWWDVMPALLKGFFDKVFLPGWAFAEADASPMLGHISGATAITTMGAPQAIHTSVDSVLCKGILRFCGIARTKWFNILDVAGVGETSRKSYLDEISGYFRKLG